jgi:hypothetical protein
VLWRNESPTPDEQQAIDELTGLRSICRRVGHGEPGLSFGKDRWVLDGAAECERLWRVSQDDGAAVLTLGRLDRPACHLRQAPDGSFSVLRHESWPDAKIVAIEPHPESFELLRRGTAHLPASRSVLIQAAVAKQSAAAPLASAISHSRVGECVAVIWGKKMGRG